MPSSKQTLKTFTWMLSTFILSACVQPPFNHFQPPPPHIKPIVVGTGLGALAGGLIGNAITGAALGGALAGGAIGAGLGTAMSIYLSTKPAIIADLNKYNIQFVEYGDTMTLIIPTDHYFLADSPQLNEGCYPGLSAILQLLAFYPCSQIYVAGFTDNVGSREHQIQRSRAQAETMLTFLWANHIPAKYLKSEGYGDRHPIGDNRWIHGSAYNRRIEIQWFNVPRNDHPSLWSQMMK